MEGYLVAIPLSNSSWNKPKFKIADYDTYTAIHDFIPRDHFVKRTEEIHEAVRREYPTPLLVYATFAITSFITIMLVSVAVINVSGVFDANYMFLPMVFVLLPVTVGVLIRFRQTHYEGKGMEKFENGLVTVFKNFNTTDIPSHSIKWIFRKRDEGRRLGPPYRVLIVQADIEVEVDTLPAYEGAHQDVVVLMSPEDEMEGHDDAQPSNSPSTSALPHYNQTLQMRLIQSSPRPSATMSEREDPASVAVSVDLNRPEASQDRTSTSPERVNDPPTTGDADDAPPVALVAPEMRMVGQPPTLIVREAPPEYDFAVQLGR